VKFHDLPSEYWTEDGLSYVASMIGKPLHVDRMMENRQRLAFSRIFIVITASEEILYCFSIEDAVGGGELVDVHVEYQRIPEKCGQCSIFGHDCSKKSNQPPAAKPKMESGMQQ